MTVLIVALARFAYPYDLEWMEGGVVDHIARVMTGQPLYVEPSIHFTPYIYPPFYYWFCALLSLATGPSIVVARLVSILATAGVLLLITAEVKRSTGSWRWGLVGAGLFAGCFEMCGAWYDLARVDSLYLFLLMLCGFMVTNRPTPRSAYLAGIVAALCFLTKQSAVIVLTPFWIMLVATNWRIALRFLASSVVVVGLFLLILHLRSDGWVWFYLYELPDAHPFDPNQLWLFVEDYMWHYLPVACTSIVVLLVTVLFPGATGSYRLWAAWIVGALVSSALSLSHLGWYYNVLMPACAGGALAVALVAARFHKWLNTEPGRLPDHLAAVVIAVVAIQLASFLHFPDKHWPSAQDRAAGDRLVDLIREIDGEVIVPQTGNLTGLGGKSRWAHQMALNDIRKSSFSDIWQNVVSQRETALADRRFEAIIISRYHDGWIDLGHYYESEVLFHDSTLFVPPAGFKIRPEKVYRAIE